MSPLHTLDPRHDLVWLLQQKHKAFWSGRWHGRAVDRKIRRRRELRWYEKEVHERPTED